MVINVIRLRFLINTMASIEKTVKRRLKKEAKNHSELDDFKRLMDLFQNTKGLDFDHKDYTIAPLDTVGRRRFQSLHK